MTPMVLSDAQWALIEPHCLGKESGPGRSGGDTRVFMEAVLWIVGTGAPWRDLPEVFGNWNTVSLPTLGQARCPQRHLRCRLQRPWPAIRHDRRHHRQSPSPRPRRKRGTQSQAIGRSGGGVTTKILALSDRGNLVSSCCPASAMTGWGCQVV